MDIDKEGQIHQQFAMQHTRGIHGGARMALPICCGCAVCVWKGLCNPISEGWTLRLQQTTCMEVMYVHTLKHGCSPWSVQWNCIGANLDFSMPGKEAHVNTCTSHVDVLMISPQCVSCPDNTRTIFTTHTLGVAYSEPSQNVVCHAA